MTRRSAMRVASHPRTHCRIVRRRNRRHQAHPSSGSFDAAKTATVEQFWRSILVIVEIGVNRKSIVASVLAKAKKYRNLTRMISDRETAQRILELTAELKQRAVALAKPDEEHIRIRAREIWEENGRPSGRDQEFWYQAEREFWEAEELATHADEEI
jgi:DUF2934 family protein